MVAVNVASGTGIVASATVQIDINKDRSKLRST